jgi:DNA (cytosine-5)-methyltransferase 1
MTDRGGMLDIGLFAGAGGLAVGLRAAGFGPEDLYELDRRACDTLRYNLQSSVATLDGRVIEQDITKVDWRRVNQSARLLAAGAPCQPFSLGGKHLAERDGRNLFPEVLRATRALRPEAVLLENVRGLLRRGFQPYFEYVLRQLECPSVGPRSHELWQHHDERIRRHQCATGYEPEYRVTWRLRDAADYGIPQTRQRVFIVATRADMPPYEFPKPTHSRVALLRDQSSGRYWERHDIPRKNVAANGAGAFTLELIEESGCVPWRTVRDALSDLPPAAANEGKAAMNHWTIPGARSYHGHEGSALDLPSKTIKAGVHGVPGGENTVVEDSGRFRYYTLREIARLQTFPDAHFFCGARMHVTRQIGNAVPCDLASAIARPLFESLTRRSTGSAEAWR